MVSLIYGVVLLVTSSVLRGNESQESKGDSQHFRNSVHFRTFYHINVVFLSFMAFSSF